MADARESLPLPEEAAAAPRSGWRAAMLACLLGVYPILVWGGLAAERPRLVALLLLLLLVPAFWWARVRPAAGQTIWLAPAVTLLALLGAAIADQAAWLYVSPVAISLAFLLWFGSSLRRGAMPAVERFARLQEKTLSPAQQAWCRLWTQLWCVFFVANAAIAAALATCCPVAWWATYTGGISYALMGLMFATEWLLRQRRFARG